MDRPTALSHLPVVHAVAVELAEAGVDQATIAGRLGIPPTSVGQLLVVARAKLARLVAGDLSGGIDQEVQDLDLGQYVEKR
jgi:DNA-directed RNA polymerase specialized sigma24 family protein